MSKTSAITDAVALYERDVPIAWNINGVAIVNEDLHPVDRFVDMVVLHRLSGC